MSRFSGNVEVTSMVIRNYDDLKNLCNFDNDLNGRNGSEYLSDEAREGGFETTGDFIYENIASKLSTFEEKVIEACGSVVDTSSEYLGYNVIEVEMGSGNDSIYVATIVSNKG